MVFWKTLGLVAWLVSLVPAQGGPLTGYFSLGAGASGSAGESGLGSLSLRGSQALFKDRLGGVLSYAYSWAGTFRPGNAQGIRTHDKYIAMDQHEFALIPAAYVFKPFLSGGLGLGYSSGMFRGKFMYDDGYDRLYYARDEHSEFAFPWFVTLMAPAKYAGLSITMRGNMNMDRSFVGYYLSLVVGKIR